MTMTTSDKYNYATIIWGGRDGEGGEGGEGEDYNKYKYNKDIVIYNKKKKLCQQNDDDVKVGVVAMVIAKNNSICTCMYTVYVL